MLARSLSWWAGGMGKSTPPPPLAEEAESNERWHWARSWCSHNVWTNAYITCAKSYVWISSTRLWQGLDSQCVFLSVCIYLCSVMHVNAFMSVGSDRFYIIHKQISIVIDGHCLQYGFLKSTCYPTQRSKELRILKSIYLFKEKKRHNFSCKTNTLCQLPMMTCRCMIYHFNIKFAMCSC